MGSKVVITRSKLDLLADSVSAKSGESLPLTIGEMKVAVDSIVLNSQIIGDGELDVDENDYLYFDDDGGGGITPTGTINITTNGTHDVTNYASANVNVSSSVQTQTKSATPSESQQTITPDTGYYLSSVTVGAIDSGYVGSGVSRKSSTDLTVSGATVTAPAGYYASASSKSVASGTEGTPTAIKGTVSNHQITVTPSVTNSAGYIAGETKTGTAVTVTASELASGNKAISQNGTGIDVVGYSTVSVSVSGEGGSTERPEATENDVILIDFDGRILYSYSATEFANLSELPTLPVVKYPFIQQDGWNWTLSDAKTYVAKYKELVIGAQYVTIDGKSHVLMEIPYNAMTIAVSVNIRNAGSSSGNTITVDWGDNSEETVETGIGRNVYKSYSHTYATKGTYDIVAYCTNPNYQITDGGQNSGRQGFIKALTMCTTLVNTYQAGNYDLIICSGCTTTIGSMAKWHWGDAYVYPRGYQTTSGNSNWFSGAASQGVKYVSWPNGVVGAFYGYNYSACRILRKLTAPESSTAIAASCFNECRTLWKLNIPSGVTTIAANAFKNCTSLRELHFYPSTPPTVADATAFTGLSTACKIYVPTGKLSDYTSASNYPDSTTYVYVEE